MRIKGPIYSYTYYKDHKCYAYGIYYNVIYGKSIMVDDNVVVIRDLY